MENSKQPRALEEMAHSGDARLSSPSTARNKGPLLDALRGELENARHVLEIASGTGEHAVHFCTALPHLTWQPSDIADDALASIEAWRGVTALANIAAPRVLDMTVPRWWQVLDAPVDFILCCNMIHISPWAATVGLMQGSGALLPPGGKLAVYGPFSRDGIHTAPSNETFDSSLKARNPSWGVRDTLEVASEAEAAGLTLAREIDMPANNLVLLLERAAR